MGFFNKLRKKVRGQIAPVMPMAPVKGSIRTPDNFVAPTPIIDYLPGRRPPERTIEGIPISQLPFDPRRSSPRPRPTFEELLGRGPKIKKVEKRGGLADIIRRLQEQLRNQQFPQPMQELRAGEIMPNSPVVDRRPSPPRMPVPPAVAPDIIPNLDLGMPVMPEERMAPPVMNQMQGQPRMMMAAGGPSVVGRALSQRFKNPSNAVLGVRGRNLPDRMMPGIGDRILGSPGRGQPGGLTYGARDLNRIRNTEDAIMVGGGLGVAGMIDATNMFSEPASMDNISFMSPEAMGTDLANLRVGIDKVIDLAKNKASEMGADINEYVDRTRSAYDQQMENQRMQELDAQQGMQPFSMLMGPDMPLFRPEETDPRVNRMIESGRGRTVSDMDRESLDDILSDLEKKN
jgi:hypothetical protein